MKTRIAFVANPWTAYSREPVEVRITKSKARAAGPDGVQFHAPGWRAMCSRSMEAAVAKIERHPGFARWAS